MGFLNKTHISLIFSRLMICLFYWKRICAVDYEEPNEKKYIFFFILQLNDIITLSMTCSEFSFFNSQWNIP